MENKIFPAKIEDLDNMINFILDAASKNGFTDKKLDKIRLASEEALVNIINYAYPQKDGDIDVSCAINEKNALVIEIKDSGIAFNPLSLPEPDLTISIDKRKIGGLGVYMICQIMDEVYYKRENDKNILTMIKNK